MNTDANEIVNAIELASKHSEGLPVPRPRVEGVTVRPAVASDVQFVDQLQKMHSKMVGWMPTKQLETYIERGNVLIAEAEPSVVSGPRSAEADSRTPNAERSAAPQPVGYCIARDQYFKRDDAGIIYQLNVLPDVQRGLIGATLVKAVFERAAYGCKLFCCWCAQDIEANKFWESMGFVPLAFRAGSRGKKRVHIFWQRRIREGDVGPGATPYWFPAQTSGGSLREDRLVIPIPPGRHWSDDLPKFLPEDMQAARQLAAEERKAAEAAERKEKREHKKKAPAPATKKKRREPKVYPVALGGLWFAEQGPPRVPGAEDDGSGGPEGPEGPGGPGGPGGMKEAKKKSAVKIDPKYVSMARELRDRWLEEVQRRPELVQGAGKYDVSRRIEDQAGMGEVMEQSQRLLDAA